MRLHFYVSTGYVGCQREEIVEVEDDTTVEDIEKIFNEWLWEHIDSRWWEVEDFRRE